MDEKLIFLVKFFKEKEHRDAFLSGKLFCSPLNAFSSNTGESDKGRKDSTEGRIRLLEKDDIIVEDSETKKLTRLPKANFNIILGNLEKTPIFCTMFIGTSWLKKDGDNSKIDIPNETIKLFKEEYGQFVCLIPAKKFLTQVMEHSNKKHLGLVYSNVVYFDLFQDWIERMKVANTPHFFFQKNLSYKEEHEHRLVFFNCKTNNPLIIDLGKPIEVIENVVTVDDLINYCLTHNAEYKRTYRVLRKPNTDSITKLS